MPQSGAAAQIPSRLPLPPAAAGRNSPEGKAIRKGLIRQTKSDTFPRGEGYKERLLEMHSIRIQLLAFITAVLLIFLVILNIFPLTSSRDLIFEEKRSAISGQAAVVASSLSGLDRLAPDSVREVLLLLDLGGYSRTVVTGEDGTVVYDDAGTAGAVTDIADILTSLGGKSVFRSHFTSKAFSSSCAVVSFTICPWRMMP